MNMQLKLQPPCWLTEAAQLRKPVAFATVGVEWDVAAASTWKQYGHTAVAAMTTHVHAATGYAAATAAARGPHDTVLA